MRLARARRLRPYAAALAILLPAISAAGADDTEALESRVRHLEQELQIRDGLIRNLLNRVNVLEDAQSKPAVPAGTTPETPAAPNASSPPNSPSPEAPALGGEAAPESAASLAQLRAGAAFERTLIQHGGLLLPPFVWEIEPAFGYSHSSSDHVVIDGFTVAQVLVVGDIFNERVDRDTYQTALTARVGLPGDGQAEIRATYARVEQKVYNAQNQESFSSTSSLGDTELAYSYQFRSADGTRPGILGSLRWKIPTGEDPYDAPPGAATFGTGYHSVQATATAVHLTDPVVLYGALSYTANLAVDKPVGRVDPGDSYGFQVGMALSLNTDTSFTLGWEQRHTQRTRLDGQDVPGTYLNTGSLALGVSYLTFSGQLFDIRANIGLTRDSPDTQIAILIPIRM